MRQKQRLERLEAQAQVGPPSLADLFKARMQEAIDRREGPGHGYWLYWVVLPVWWSVLAGREFATAAICLLDEKGVADRILGPVLAARMRSLGDDAAIGSGLLGKSEVQDEALRGMARGLWWAIDDYIRMTEVKDGRRNE